MRSGFLRKYIFHLLFTLAYIGFLLLEKQWFSKNASWLSYLPTFIVHLSLMALVIYGNILVLIPFLLQRKRIVLYIIGIIVLIAAHTLLRSIYHRYIFNIIYDEPPQITTLGVDYGESFVYGVWFTVVSSMLFITQRWYDHQQQVKNIQINQLQTELKYLRAQLNPHFLFNGLNTVYGYIDMNNQQARNVLLQFSDLLRYNLYEADVDWIDIGKERSYLENYVALQRARSSSSLQITLDINIEDKNVKIAPLIFIAFVENAFKFTDRDESRTNNIHISLQQKGKQVIFECSNNFEEQEQSPGGIGLVNVKRRLELLYKDRYTLEVQKQKNPYYVRLIINL